MRALLRRLVARVTGRIEPDVAAAATCLHPSFGACHYRTKGTAAPYKGAGWFKQCTYCRQFVPC